MCEERRKKRKIKRGEDEEEMKARWWWMTERLMGHYSIKDLESREHHKRKEKARREGGTSKQIDSGDGWREKKRRRIRTEKTVEEKERKRITRER